MGVIFVEKKMRSLDTFPSVVFFLKYLKIFCQCDAVEMHSFHFVGPCVSLGSAWIV